MLSEHNPQVESIKIYTGLLIFLVKFLACLNLQKQNMKNI